FNDTATTEIYTLSLHDALPISGVEALDRRHALALIQQLAVGRVLEDDDVILLGELDETPPPRQAHRAARRVLVVGNGVDELDPLGAAQDLLEGAGVHALLV